VDFALCVVSFALDLLIKLLRARRETRTLKGFLPTASETATFTNFATRARGLEAQIYYINSDCNVLLKKVFARKAIFLFECSASPVYPYLSDSSLNQ
jgi:hypothetical protein